MSHPYQHHPENFALAITRRNNSFNSSRASRHQTSLLVSMSSATTQRAQHHHLFYVFLWIFKTLLHHLQIATIGAAFLFRTAIVPRVARGRARSLLLEIAIILRFRFMLRRTLRNRASGRTGGRNEGTKERTWKGNEEHRREITMSDGDQVFPQQGVVERGGGARGWPDDDDI
jgi:hypothetical protein